MDVRVLRYFIAAVEAESISGAAERLHLTQPTLSRQFMELEAELGHKLFVRSNRRLRLTPKGELFFDRARSIVDLCDRTKREMLEEDLWFSEYNRDAKSELRRARRRRCGLLPGR